MADTLRTLRPPGEQAVERNRNEPVLESPSASAGTLRCAFCQADVRGDAALTSGKSRRGEHESTFCSPRCRDCVHALAGLHPSPLASPEFIATRGLLTDRLLDLWRQGLGPEPAVVVRAAEAASCGLDYQTPPGSRLRSTTDE
jgi:hypothetical protein